MRQLLLISLPLLCLASAFPSVNDETLNQLPEADKVLIRNMVLRLQALTNDLISETNHPIFPFVKSMLSCKKADQRMLDDLQNWVNRVKADEGTSLEAEDIAERLGKMEDLINAYHDPEKRELRNRLNLWTDGQFDVIMSKFNQTLKQHENALTEVFKTTISSLSDATKMSYSNLIAKMNSGDEYAEWRLFSELTKRAVPKFDEYRTKFQEMFKNSFK